MAKQFETFNLDDEEEKTPEFKVNQPSDLNLEQPPMMEKPEDTYDYQKEGDKALAEASALEDNQPDDIDSLITALQPKPEEKLKIDHRYANDVSREPNELEKLLKGEGPIVRQSGGAPYSSQQVKPEEIKEAGKPASVVEQQPALPSPSILTQQLDDENEYEKALRRRDLAILANQLGKASTQIGSSIAQVKPGDLSAFDTNIALARDIPKDVLEKFKYDEQDPNSKMSRDLRATIETITQTSIPENMSVSKIKELKIFDGIIKLRQAEYLKEYREGQLGLGEKKITSAEKIAKDKLDVQQKIAAARRETQESNRSDKLTKENNRRMDRLHSSLSDATAKGNNAYVNALRTKAGVKNALALVNGYKNLDEIPSTIQFELARSLDKIITGTGASTAFATKHLLPETLEKYIQERLQYITNQIRGTNSGTFVKSMLRSFDNESNTADKYIKDAKEQFFSGYSDLKDDERFRNILETHGIDINDLAWNKSESKKSSTSDKDTKKREVSSGTTISDSKNKPTKLPPKKDDRVEMLAKDSGKYSPKEIQSFIEKTMKESGKTYEEVVSALEKRNEANKLKKSK